MKDIGTRKIETDRLILRRFLITDVDGMYDGWGTDENTAKYVSWNVHQNKEETYKIIANWIDEYEKNSYNWAVELKNTNQLIGNISARSVDRKNHNCEMGYCFGSKYWNMGYATEALKAVIQYLKNDCEMHVIEAKHYRENPASGKVMEKAGMTFEAVLKDRRFHEATKDYSDLICYVDFS